MSVVNLRNRHKLYESRTLREWAAALRWTLLRRDTLDLAHLAFYTESEAGPVQRDEALLLFALVRVTRPQTVVEVGFDLGHSAYNFLRAMDPDARLYSFDIDPRCDEVAARRFRDEPRITYRRRSQERLSPEDIDGRRADLVLIDAAHDLDLNQRLFERLLPMLAPRAIVAVHDTGTVPRELLPDARLGRPDRWVGDEYEHQPDERAFVNWIRDEHPAFDQLHLHATCTTRYGLTLLQKGGRLPRPDDAAV